MAPISYYCYHYACTHAEADDQAVNGSYHYYHYACSHAPMLKLMTRP